MFVGITRSSISLASIQPKDKESLRVSFVHIHSYQVCPAYTLTGYQASSSKEHLLKVFEDFSPVMQALLGMADPQAIRVWPLLDQQALGTWINGKSCLLGDAAHPFLPRQSIKVPGNKALANYSQTKAKVVPKQWRMPLPSALFSRPTHA